MTDDVDREATHDWLDERDALRADELPHPSEYRDDGWTVADKTIEDPDGRHVWIGGVVDGYRAFEPDEFICDLCGHPLLTNEGPTCHRCR